MTKLSSYLAALTLALGLSLGATSASAVTVNFSFSTVTGYLTFGSIGDTTADSVTMTSNSFGEGSSFILNLTTANEFTWLGNDIVSSFFTANRDTFSYFTQLFMFTSLDFFEYECSSNSLTPVCGGSNTKIISADEITFTTLQPVPLPAGSVLLLTGLAGVAGLRMRKKRGTQV